MTSAASRSCYGGISAEREVSLASGAPMHRRAARGRASRSRRSMSAPTSAAVIAALAAAKPDVVFNTLHGRFGEDGCIQGVLDWLQLPYTHSGVRASASPWTSRPPRRCSPRAGLPVCAHRAGDAGGAEAADPMPRPFVVKPLERGLLASASPSCATATTAAPPSPAEWRFGPQHHGRALYPRPRADRRRHGRPRAGASPRSPPHLQFYDYEAKYADGGSRHAMPAPIHPDATRQAMEVAVAAHRALGCRGVSRADFRYDDTQGEPGRLFLLEVNTQPGMTPHLAGAGTGRACRHRLPRALRLDGRAGPPWPVAPPPARGATPRPAPAPRSAARRAGRPRCGSGCAAAVACCARPGSACSAPARLIVAALAVMAADPYGRLAAIWDGAAEIAAGGGLQVKEVQVEGMHHTPPELGARSARRAPRRPDPRLRPAWAREQLEQIAWVEHAHVERLLPGTIRVRLEERQPFAIWQRDGKFSVIDRRGQGGGDRECRRLRPPAADRRRRRRPRRGADGRCAARRAPRCRSASMRWSASPSAAGTCACATAPTCCCRKARRPRRSTAWPSCRRSRG